MFETLSKGFRAAKNRLAGVTELTESNLDAALRDVRLSLLEADVEFHVAKEFLARVKQSALGETVQTRVKHKGQLHKVTPAAAFIKICQDELVRMMRHDERPLAFAGRGKITGIMMVGLQGSGKTTSSAKLARLLKEEGKRPLLVGADIQRPAAIEQLKVLGERLDIPVFSIPGGRPVDICAKASSEARRLRCDVIIYDTAGRLAVDEPLMEELAEIKSGTQPKNIYLVVDSMIGQDSVKTAGAFHQRLGITGVILTKLDGDARGGAAISIRESTGAPVAFVGTGEGLDRLEPFRPDGMASRILGFGDIVGLMKDFEQVVDERRAEADAKRMLKGQFTLDDFMEQLRSLQQMGPLQDVLERLPFFSEAVPDNFSVDDRELVRLQAMIQSMTPAERNNAMLFHDAPTRIGRVANGSGRTEKEVAELLQRFLFMRKMMGDIGKQAGMLQNIPGMRELAMSRNLKSAVGPAGGIGDNPMMASLAETLLEAAVVGDGPQMNKPARRTVNRDQRKAAHKKQRKARRKSRR